MEIGPLPQLRKDMASPPAVDSIEHLLQLFQVLPRRPLVFLDDFDTAAFHGFGPVRMDEDIQAGVDKFLFILDHDAGAAATEEIEDFTKLNILGPTTMGLP